MSLPTINTYPLTSPSSGPRTIETVLSHLRNLPGKEAFKNAIPLYRRLQVGKFSEASRLLTNLDLEEPSEKPQNSSGRPTSDKTPSGAWLYVFIDRSCRPETEAYLVCSWEVEDSSNSHTQNGDSTTTKDKDRSNLLSSLLHAISNLGVPKSIHSTTPTLNATAASTQANIIASDSPTTTSSSSSGDTPSGETKDSVGLSASDYGSHLSNPSISLWGAIHEKTVPLLKTLGVLAQDYSAGLMPNHMFIFDIEKMAAYPALPEGLRWGELSRHEHYSLVRSRTQIPRSEKTLSCLPSLAIYPEGSEMPIAWVFVGLDASLTSLHVEPEYRGKGLAKAITTKLLKEKTGPLYKENGLEMMAHGYVIVGNEASASMCRSLGAKADWEVYWLRVDLSKI